MGKWKQHLAEHRRRIGAEEYPEIGLRDKDPILWELLYTKLSGLVNNARETAIHISSSPVVKEMGECIFAFFTPEGDSVCFSRGIVVHVASMGGAVKFMLDNDYEEDVGINDGDFFFNNDPYVGGAHSQDQTLLTPVFVRGELVGWAGGLSHVPETGSKEPGGHAVTGVSRFEEGIYWPCVKVGENNKLKRDLEMVVERGTRTPIWWLMDTRAKAAAISQIRGGVVALVEEFGLEYFREVLYEYIEDTRRACLNKVSQVFYPGRYRSAIFYGLPNSQRPVLYPRDHLVRIEMEAVVAPDGTLHLNFEGTSPAGLHCYNSTFSATLGNLLLGVIQYVLYDVKYSEGIFQALFHPSRLNLPACTLNPPDHTFGVSLWGPGSGGAAWGAFMDCIARSYYARGFREEVTSSRNSGAGGLRWAGRDQYGRPSSGQNFEMGCAGMPACAAMDGLDTCYSAFNPEGDMSDAEVWERVFPFVWLGRTIQQDGGGFGRFRGGSAIRSVYLVEHVDSIQVSTSGIARHGSRSPGLMGAYPVGGSTMTCLRMPNFEEIVAAGIPLPHLGGAAYGTSHPDSPLQLIPLSDVAAKPVQDVRRHDLICIDEGGAGGVGDPLDRDPEAVATDVAHGITSPRVARQVYGIALVDGKVDSNATADLRQQHRHARLRRGVPAAEYIRQQRDRILRGEIPSPAREGLNECLQHSPTFRAEFVNCWALPKEFTAIPAKQQADVVRAPNTDRKGGTCVE